MKPEDIKNSIDKIEPGAGGKQRVFANVAARARRSGAPRYKRVLLRVGAAAAAMALIAGAYFAWPGGSAPPGHELTGDNAREDSSGERAGTKQELAIGPGEDMVAPAADQFYLNGRLYFPLYQELAEQYGLSLSVAEGDAGKKLGRIDGAAGAGLGGLEVCEYLPAGGEAVVAVKTDGGYRLFYFFSFEKYMQNADEDAAAYLQLYGIRAASDIVRVEFLRYSGSTLGNESSAADRQGLTVAGLLTDPEGIAEFYGYFSVLKDSSKAYFEKLYDSAAVRETDGTEPGGVIPPDYGGTVSEGRLPAYEGSGEIGWDTPAYEASGGAAAWDLPAEYTAEYVSPGVETPGSDPAAPGKNDLFSGAVHIRIYTASGLFYETIYYPAMGFISRFEIGPDFAEFLEARIGQ